METINICSTTRNVVRINRKSDFPLAVKLGEGDFPDCDFTLKATSGSGFVVYKAERKGGKCVNCKMADGQLVVFFDNHSLAAGRLKIELSVDHPDENYADGFRREALTALTNIELVDDNGDNLNFSIPSPSAAEKEKTKLLIWQIR